MDSKFITSFELTISLDAYNTLRNLAEDYNFQSTLPIRRNIFIPVAMYEGTIESTDFKIDGQFSLTALRTMIAEENGKKVLFIHGINDEVERLSSAIDKKVSDGKPILTKPLCAMAICPDYTEDDINDLNRDMVQYFNNEIVLGEFTIRYDTHDQMMNLLNAFD